MIKSQWKKLRLIGLLIENLKKTNLKRGGKIMYRNKFNDIEPGTIFINKDRTKLYEIIGMFSAYLKGTLLITRNLSGEKIILQNAHILQMEIMQTRNFVFN